MAVAYRLLELCQQKGLSLNDLARRSLVPLSTIKNILNGSSRNPGIATISKLCAGLGVSVAEFFAADSFSRLPAETEGEE
jgi:transcriptional regulator with XRE-family HTH domain